MARKAPKYRLQPLVGIKERARRQAEIRLAKAIVRLEQEKKRLTRFEEERKKIIERRRRTRREMHEKVSGGAAKAQDGWLGINFLKKLEEDQKEKEREIEVQKRTIEDCETAVKRCRRDYVDAARELRVMEKHKELWWKKVRQEIEREEEKELDELGAVIHELKKVA